MILQTAKATVHANSVIDEETRVNDGEDTRDVCNSKGIKKKSMMKLNGKAECKGILTINAN